ncbi:hypothetical protein CEXT_782391 [Caerostris extrusa]|uniref:Uncharacterized protein n=1 Tax=Caerostris extrusa TaxID=172846 RepID=A0AAV4MIF9_CAEEX|nr:hypothetical protein CEXT_782391 [Caerostris extrusa]
MDSIIFRCNRFFIAGVAAKAMDLRPFKFASVPPHITDNVQHVRVMWCISDKPYMHRPFPCVNRPESSVTCEAFRPVIGHRGFGSR